MENPLEWWHPASAGVLVEYLRANGAEVVDAVKGGDDLYVRFSIDGDERIVGLTNRAAGYLDQRKPEEFESLLHRYRVIFGARNISHDEMLLVCSSALIASQVPHPEDATNESVVVSVVPGLVVKSRPA